MAISKTSINRLPDPSLVQEASTKAYLFELTRLLRLNLAVLVDGLRSVGVLTSIVVTDTSTFDSSKDIALVDATDGSFTLTLPSCFSFANRTLTVKRIDAVGANSVTVEPDGSEEIDGSTSVVLSGTGLSSVTLYSDGTNWWII